MNPSRSLLPEVTATPWVWVATFSPAVLILILLWPLRGMVPYLDAWAFVLQYHHWVEGHLGWSDLLEPHYVPPSAVGKVIYFAVLHWLGGNVSVLPLLTWAFAVVVAASACVLARPLWSEGGARGAVLMLLTSLTVFSAAQGEVWTWGFLFQNSIPGVCLMVGLVVLSAGPPVVWRILVAASLCVVATFSFATGILVGPLLALLLWHQTVEKSMTHRWFLTGAWLSFNAVMGWVALGGSAGGEAAASAGILLERPWMRLQFMLVLLGQVLGKGTVFEPEALCATMGGVLVLVSAACAVHVFRRRHERVLITAALPWIVCSLYGAGSAGFICIGRSFNSLNNSLDERYSALSLFFVVGTVLLAAVVMAHGDAASHLARGLRKGAVPVVVVLLLAHAVNWERGWQSMKLAGKRMKQERAMLVFAAVLPPDPGWMEPRLSRKSSFRMVQLLAETRRLPALKLVTDTRIAHFTPGMKAPIQWARFDKPVMGDDGRWRLAGLGGLSSETAVDLILITAQSAGNEERIVTLAAPLLPDTFFERHGERRRHPQHYLGWRHLLARAALPEGPVTLRAYTYDADKQQVRRMEGVHLLQMTPK